MTLIRQLDGGLSIHRESTSGVHLPLDSWIQAREPHATICKIAGDTHLPDNLRDGLLSHFKHVRSGRGRTCRFIKVNVIVGEHLGIAPKEGKIRRSIVKIQSRCLVCFIDTQDRGRAVETRRGTWRTADGSTGWKAIFQEKMQHTLELLVICIVDDSVALQGRQGFITTEMIDQRNWLKPRQFVSSARR